MKKRSSKWAKTRGADFIKFAWQGGYGVFSVGESGAGRARRYIERQKAHQQQSTFQEEYRDFLKRHRVEFDERYLWD